MPARTGQDYLNGLKATNREIWLGGERVESVAEHPLLRGGAEAIAAYYDLQHQYPDELLIADPETGEEINISHMQPRSVEDLQRRHVGLARISELSMGVMGRTPDYMNVTFAGFADDRLRWAAADGSNEAGYDNLVAFQKRLRRDDLSLTHTIIHPTVDKKTDGNLVNNPVPLHKVGETADSIIVRGARLLATLAPYADEQTVYPAVPMPGDGPTEYALSFTVAMDTPGLVFLCRDSGMRPGAHPLDAPFSTRFDEQDALCIFDDVEVPKANVFIDGNIGVYNSVMLPSSWWPNIMQQTTIRALTKLEFAYALATRMAEAVNDVSERTLEMLGEIQSYIEITRNAILLSELNAKTWESGGVYPEARALHPMRSILPEWFPRVNEIIKVIGSHNLLAAASRGQLDDPRILALMNEFQPGANGISAEDRSGIYRVAWDFAGSLLGSRNELYERNYLASSKTNRIGSHLFHSAANRERGNFLVDKLLADARSRMSARTWALDEIQPGNPDFWTLPPADIDAAFAVLRRDSPVTFHEEFEVTPGMPIGPGFWSIVRHADVKMVGRQPQLFSSVSGVVIGDQTAEMDDFFGSMIGLDPPEHSRLRKIIQKGFTPKAIGQLEQQVRDRARRVVADAAPSGGGDFVELFAVPFALQIICEMMGIPPADERRMFEITNVILGPSDPDCNVDFEQFIRDTKELFDYAIDLAKGRLAHPCDDIATTLVQAEVDGERLTAEEFARFTILLVIAGNDTTRTALSHGIKLLTDHPDQRTIWTGDFAGVAPTAVDEIVRVGTPTLHMRRRAVVDTEIAGQSIKAGDKVVMWYYSANRDEAVYDDPLRFDVRRKGDLVGFGGGGPHYCIGAALARREMTVMFDEIFTTLPDLTVTGEPEMLRSNFIHGIKQLPCEFTPRS